MIQIIEPNRIDQPITDIAATTESRAQSDPQKNENMLSSSAARMVCVLTLLAASMVGGSAVLAWLEPRAEQAVVSPAIQREQARVAVSGTRDPIRHWTGVTLIQVDETQPVRRNALTAVSDRGEAHFVISSAGAIRALPRWSEQRPIGDGYELRIGMQDPENPPLAQRRALSALLDALQPHLGDDAVVATPPANSRSNS